MDRVREHGEMGIRTIVLVRHGQYRLDDGPDPGLTLLGQTQARYCEVLLRREKFSQIVTSSLVRARETCATIVTPWKESAQVSDLLVEGVPTRVASLGVSSKQAAEDRARFDLAYGTFFAPSQLDRTDLLVCHGNLIRYLVSRALGVAPRIWTRFISNHCGITRIVVRDTRMRVVSYNETAHLPADCIT